MFSVPHHVKCTIYTIINDTTILKKKEKKKERYSFRGWEDHPTENTTCYESSMMYRYD